MSTYDFRALSDKEFEVLCCDLLGTTSCATFERFKPGRDGGVDGRYFSPDGEVVLQCKHWLSTPLNQLINHLVKTEAPKVAKLKPSRYILAISQPLSRADKRKIFEIFTPFLKCPSDILGNEDLNDILAAHQAIERRHYKLWIGSAGVLNSVLNASIYGRSDFLLSDIIANGARYAVTRNHTAALEILGEKHVVIITGAAGVGKTTLARNMLIPHLSDGYEIFAIGENITEAESVFSKSKKQIFYFDDFLGSNYLDAISGNSGAQIVQFMRRIKADPLKRFILTSRTTILNQGKILINALAEANTARDEFEISLQSISPLEKATILYNHVWHSGLSDDYKEEVRKEKRYRSVVNHKNFNPRIISYVTDDQRLDGVEPSDYWAHILALLNNPADVWAHPFEAQHDDYGRALILLVSINGRSLSQQELSDAYYRYVNRPSFLSARGHQDYLRNLRQLSGSMLNRVVHSGGESISLFNPSIRDFILSRYSSDPVTITEALRALRTTDSLNAARSLLLGASFNESIIYNALHAISKDADDASYVGYIPDYIARLYDALVDWAKWGTPAHIEMLTRAASFIEAEPLPLSFVYILDFYLAARKHGLNVPVSLNSVVEQACSKEPSSDELTSLFMLMQEQACTEQTLDVYRDAVQACLSEQIYDEFPAHEVFEGIYWDGDWGEAASQLKDQIKDRLSNFGLANDWELIREIAGHYDFDDQAETYYVRQDRGGSQSRDLSRVDTFRDIDDLFERG